MDEFIGKNFIIIEDSGSYGFRLINGCLGFNFPYFVLGSRKDKIKRLV